jgi:hypothetical protein
MYSKLFWKYLCEEDNFIYINLKINALELPTVNHHLY